MLNLEICHITSYNCSQLQYVPERCRIALYSLDLEFGGDPFYKVEVVGWKPIHTHNLNLSWSLSLHSSLHTTPPPLPYKRGLPQTPNPTNGRGHTAAVEQSFLICRVSPVKNMFWWLSLSCLAVKWHRWQWLGDLWTPTGSRIPHTGP